jgi:large subunit ribosomal protein L30
MPEDSVTEEKAGSQENTQPSGKAKRPRAPRKPKASTKERRRQESPSDRNDAFSPESPRDAAKKPAAPRKPAVRKPRVVKAPKPAAESKAPAETGREATPKPEAPKAVAEKRLFAVVRVRGSVGITRQLSDTLMMLRLHRINHCVIIPKNQNYDGMLHKARNFITWGEIDRETLEKLVAKRGRFAGDKRVKDVSYAKELAHFILSGKPVKETGIKPVFRLSPPSKGYKSTKAIFPKGSLGYRGEKINELLKRMI